MKPPTTLFVSWQDEDTRRILPIGRLVRDGNVFEFAYINSALKAQEYGFEPLLSFPELGRVYRSASLPPLFENRVMPRSREDFGAYVEALGLAPEHAEPFSVLARSGGRRATDHLEVFAPPALTGELAEGLFLARGIRHIPNAERVVATSVRRDDRLVVRADPTNAANKLALALETVGQAMIGYVPDYLAMELGRLQASCTDLVVRVAQVNLDPAPVHHRLLCHFTYPIELGRQLFRGSEYAPIAGDAVIAA
jgi:hypothetical protein